MKEHQLQHVAVIMDGNGRWAKAQGKMRVQGHQEGIKRVKEIIKAAAHSGIGYLTLYAFSQENWSRPKMEVEALMSLLIMGLEQEVKEMHQHNIRLCAIGDLEQLPSAVRKALQKAMELTQNNTQMVVSIALSYGSQQEITSAVRQIAQKVEQGFIAPSQIDATTIEQHLYTRHLPPVDLLIRTSGECRISNFLLWQIAYAELYFTQVYWPDFSTQEWQKAIESYYSRDRRFGKIS